MSYLDEWVDHSDVRAGVENLVKVGLSVDQLQLVELLIILEEQKKVISRWSVSLKPSRDPGRGQTFISEGFSQSAEVPSYSLEERRGRLPKLCDGHLPPVS